MSEQGRTIFEAQNNVDIDRPFYIQTTEVTQHQWQSVMGSNPSYFFECGEECPVENISWADTQTFIKALNKMDSSSTYRLPTEAEWEYACRSGNNLIYSYGDLSTYDCSNENMLDRIAWYNCNSQGKTHPVRQKTANDWGIYDMHGNVYEWCQDIYVTNYAQILSGRIDEENPIVDRVGRGCAFNDSAVSCRPAARVNLNPNIRSKSIGFRLVREPVYYKINIPASNKNLATSARRIDNNQQNELKPQLTTESKGHGPTLILQIAAMRNEKYADELTTKLKEKGYSAYKLSSNTDQKGTWYIVRIGYFNSVKKAKHIQAELAKINIQSTIIEKR